MDQLPSFKELFEVAPVAAIVLLIVGIGFYIGWRSRGEAVTILREWLEEQRRK
jgi:predicted negative regulator of RcsB-dependent stress response